MLILYISCPSPKNPPFLQGALVPFIEGYIRNQDLGTRCKGYAFKQWFQISVQYSILEIIIHLNTLSLLHFSLLKTMVSMCNGRILEELTLTLLFRNNNL